jgi:O-antigen/teichoic acid export membrane protein
VGIPILPYLFYMKTNTNLILHHILWRGLYFFSILLLNIGIARFFAAEKSGHIFYIVNNLALILLLASISLESGCIYYIASENLEVTRMARLCLVWAVLASGIALAGWWAILHIFHSAYLKDPGFILASFLFILGVLLTTYFTALFYAKKQFSLPNKILFGVNMLLIIILNGGKNVITIKAHFIDLYFSFFFLQGLLLVVFFFKQNPGRHGSFLPSRPVLIKVIRYSLAALLANGIYFLVNRIDYWIVQYYCSGKDLGNYIQASRLGQMLLIIPAILGSTLFPIFSSREKSENVFQLTTAMRVLFWINSVICLLILCFGWFIFPFIFGSSFSKMYMLFVFLVPGILCVTMNYPMTAWFSADKRIGINIRGSLLALIVICTGDLLTLPHYGVPAASVMSSAGYFSYYGYTMYRYRKENTFPWKDFLLIRKSDINRIRQSFGSKTQETLHENSIAQNLIP